MKKLLLYLLLFTSFSLSAQVPSYVPTDSLVGWWPFNGNANDESGNNLDGIASGGALLISDRFGSSSSAYFFDGVDDVITIPDDNALDVQINSFSISAWVLTTVNGVYINKTLDANQSEGFEISSVGSGEAKTAVIYGGGQASYRHSASAINDSSWHHVVMVFNLPSNYDVYIDGVLDNGLNLLPNPPLLSGNNLDLQFGARQSTFYTSSLDDIGIWNRALDSTEIQVLYAAAQDTCTYYDTIIVYDTIAVYDTITYYDTVLVSVTDTLIIDVTLSGIPAPNNINTIKVYPNPASDIVIIDNGDYSSMTNYTLEIVNSLGQNVFSSLITIPQFQIPVSTFGSTGTYFIRIIDPSSQIIDTRKLILN